MNPTTAMDEMMNPTTAMAAGGAAGGVVQADDKVGATVNFGNRVIEIDHRDVNGRVLRVRLWLQMNWCEHNGPLPGSNVLRGGGRVRYETTMKARIMEVVTPELEKVNVLGVVGTLGFTVKDEKKGLDARPPCVVCEVPRGWHVQPMMKLEAVDVNDCIRDGEKRTFLLEYFDDNGSDGLERANVVMVDENRARDVRNGSGVGLVLDDDEELNGYHFHYASGEVMACGEKFKTSAIEHVCSVEIVRIAEGKEVDVDRKSGNIVWE